MKKVVIKANNLIKKFDTGEKQQTVLNGISVEIYDGDFTIVMGSSGSGKSTLLYSLSMLDKPTSGTVELLSTVSDKASQKAIEKLRQEKIAFVFQNFNLLPDLTAFENIAYPAYLSMSRSNANKRTLELLEQLGLKEEKDKYPANLSGGQMQRIAMARALVKSPSIVFADEPTGALNSMAGKQVLDILSETNKNGQTIVMVTHDIKACARGNRVLYVADGNITGELDLGQYEPACQKEREEKVFDFLTKNNW